MNRSRVLVVLVAIALCVAFALGACGTADKKPETATLVRQVLAQETQAVQTLAPACDLPNSACMIGRVYGVSAARTARVHFELNETYWDEQEKEHVWRPYPILTAERIVTEDGTVVITAPSNFGANIDPQITYKCRIVAHFSYTDDPVLGDWFVWKVDSTK